MGKRKETFAPGIGDRIKLRGREAYGVLCCFHPILKGAMIWWEPGTFIPVRWSDRPVRPALWVGISELEAEAWPW